MKTLKFAVLALAILFFACDRGDRYIADSESEKIMVKAFVGMPGSESKDTTISILDTVYLNGYASSNSTLKLKSYFWTNDTGGIRSDYQIKTFYKKPGTYYPVFNIVDHFGDTLSDTVRIQVITPPDIDTLHFTPANNTEFFPRDSAKFAWTSQKTEESTLYQFQLSCGGISFADTTLRAPYFILKKTLPEYESCNWSVASTSESGIEGNSFSAFFKTTGRKGFGRITGTFYSDKTLLENVIISIANEEKTDTLSLDDSKFDTGIIPIGTYLLKAELNQYPDYGSNSFEIKLQEGFIQNASLALYDNIAPQFSKNLNDTIPYSTTLHLPMENRGLPLSLGSSEATLDGVPINSDFSEDTLVLKLPDYALPLCKILKIKVTDAAANSVNKKFYVCPQSAWADIPQDTAISIKDSLELYYREKNSYGLNAIKILWYSGNQQLMQNLQDGEAKAGLAASFFGIGQHRIYIKTFYENGLEVISYFNLEITE